MTDTPRQGRLPRWPLLFLLLPTLLLLAACWPLSDAIPASVTATVTAPATLTRVPATLTTAPATAPPDTATAPPAATSPPNTPPTAAAATATTEPALAGLPPHPTWPPPPLPDETPPPTPAALRTAGPGAALPLPPEVAPGDVAAAVRPSAAGDLTGKDAWPRYQLALRLDPTAGQLWGHERLRVTNTEDRPLDRIVLRLVPNFPASFMDEQALSGAARLRVGPVQLDDAAVAATYADANTSLVVPLATPLAVGATAAVSFDFALDLRNLSQDPNIWYFQSFYPILAVYDAGAWHEEVTDFPDRVYAESSFYDVTLTTPNGMVVSTSGSEVDHHDNGDSTTTYSYRAGPVREWSATVCGPCQTADTTTSDIHVRVTYQPADEAEGRAMLATAARALEVYSTRYGPYPFREFDVIVRPGLSGGIEYPGLIYVGPGMRGGAVGRDFLVAHETAHQWWYSVVGDDIFREAWLDESFANYSSVIFAQDAEGAGAGNTVLDQIVGATWEPYRLNKLNADPSGDDPVGWALWQFHDFGEYNEIIYGKGAVFLHKLRLLMGDDAFFAGIQAHFAANKYGVTTGRGFLTSMLAHAGDKAPAVATLYRDWIEGR